MSTDFGTVLEVPYALHGWHRHVAGQWQPEHLLVYVNSAAASATEKVLLAFHSALKATSSSPSVYVG